MVRSSGQAATSASAAIIGSRKSRAARTRCACSSDRLADRDRPGAARRTSVEASWWSWRALPRLACHAGGRAGPRRLARGGRAAGGYQPPPLSSSRSSSSISRLSAAGVVPDSVSCTADQNFEETSLYFTLVGADGRGTAFRKTSFQRGMSGCAAAISASS